MKVLIISNIPAPYKIDFFNELGKFVELTVIFEAKRVDGIKFNWNEDFNSFKSVFLSGGIIKENKFNFKILKYIHKNEYDFIISTNYAYRTELLAIIKMILFRIPFLLEIDGGIIRKNEFFLKNFLKRFIIKHAEYYFSPSTASDEFLKNYGASEEKIFRYPFSSLQNSDILPEPLSAEEKQTLRKKLGITEEKAVLAVGRFINIKGFDILIKAAEKLSDNTGIYFVGGNPIDEYIALKENLNLDNVHFVGFKSKEELKEYYKAADVFVLPTRGDVWGLVINESMACGLPIITTDRCIAGLELVKNGKNGYIVPVDDVSELAEKINQTFADEDECKKMGQNSISVIRDYTIENMALRHFEILKELRTVE